MGIEFFTYLGTSSYFVYINVQTTAAEGLPSHNNIYFEFRPCLNAVVANRAMRASRWTVKLTGVAPLHSDSDSSDFHVFVQRRSKVVFRNLGSLTTAVG